jgi:hypothetical protein
MTKCRTGKRRYRYEQDAKKALTRIHQTGEKRANTPVRAYPCGMCGGWHLTHQDGDGASTAVEPRPAPPQPPPRTPLEEAEMDRSILEGVILRAIARGDEALYDPAWGEYRIRRGMTRNGVGTRASVAPPTKEGSQ